MEERKKINQECQYVWMEKKGGGVWHRVELLGTWQQQQVVLTGIPGEGGSSLFNRGNRRKKINEDNK
jgi:hypothetical protein